MAGFSTWMEAAGQFGGGSQPPASSGGAFGGGVFGGGQFGGTGVTGGLLSQELARQGGLFTGRGVTGDPGLLGVQAASQFGEDVSAAGGLGTAGQIKSAFGQLTQGLGGTLASRGLAGSSLLGAEQSRLGTEQERALGALPSEPPTTEPPPTSTPPTGPGPPPAPAGFVLASPGVNYPLSQYVKTRIYGSDLKPYWFVKPR